MNVDTLNFSLAATMAMPVQTWFDTWRSRERTCRYMGLCRACSTPTWAFDDGENDPRGVLGDHAYWPVENRYGVDIVACPICANDEPTYRLLHAL